MAQLIKKRKITFQQFLYLFPEMELPITLTTDTHHTFSQTNQPLPYAAIEAYILENEVTSEDEFTEFVPCFRLPKTIDFHAIVFWKAALLTYEYYMMTFDKKGNFIDKRKIGGTKTEGNTLVQSVVTIEDDWIIYVVEGGATLHEKNAFYNAASSKTYNLELLATGKIINLFGD